MITYGEFFQFVIMMTNVITLCYIVFKNDKK